MPKLTDIKAVPLEKFDWDYFLPSFSPEELCSPGVLAAKVEHLIDVESALKLQRFRDYIFQKTGSGLWVNYGSSLRRGLRTIDDQRQLAEQNLGAAESASMHCAGRAFDLTMTNWGTYTPTWLAGESVQFGWAGVGTYRNFVHVDTRTSFTGKATTWSRK